MPFDVVGSPVGFLPKALLSLIGIDFQRRGL